MIKIGKLPPNCRFNSIKLRESSLENPLNHMFMSIFSSTRDTAPEHQYMYIYIYACDMYIYIYVALCVQDMMKINPRFVDKLKLSMNIVGVIPPPIPQIFNNFPLKKRGSAEHESEPMTCQPLPNIPSSFMTFTNSSNIPRFGRRFKS